jgi:polysaccharide biosynthesis/export protein
MNPNEVRPSDIPSEQVLRQMGLSEEEISEAMDFKYSRGKYSNNESDYESDTSSLDNVQKFYKNMEKKIPEKKVKFPKARIYGQDLFRINDISFFQQSTSENPPSNYEIGPSDKISIAVWGNSDYTAVVTVDGKGYISPSGFGRIYVKGLTFSQARSLIRRKLGMNNSEMDISLVYSRVILVNIVGEVYNPGSYAIPAINTAFNALMVAKGPTQIGSVRNIFIKRDGKVIDSLDVYEFLFNPSEHTDIYLQDGDYIVVSAATNLVEVKGEVNRPYTYEVKSSDNMDDVIAFAGGYTTEASQNIITLKRFEDGKLLVHDVHKKDLLTTNLNAADEIIVNKIQRKTSNFISVQGTVGVEGDYEFIQGEKISDLLKRANCLNEYLYKENAYILRLNSNRSRTTITVNLHSALDNSSLSSKDNITLKEYDIINVMSIDDFQDDYIVSVFGSVRKIGDLVYGSGLKLTDVIELSGGIKQEASGSRIEISRVLEVNSDSIIPKRSVVLVAEINKNLSLKPEDNNFILQANDQIFVRKNPDYKVPINVVIDGEVMYPGTYSLISEGDRISDIIERCGGLTENAFLEGVKLYRRTKIFSKEKSDNIISEDFKEVILSDTALYEKYSEDLFNSELEVLSEEIETEDIAYNVVSFDMKEALRIDSKHNIILLEGDSLVIPRSNSMVYITGDLYNYEGNGISVPYFERKRANYYINNFAGGYSKENNKNRTVVVYPNGSVKRSVNFGFFSLSPKVTKGSMIKLMSKEQVEEMEATPLDWNVAIEKTLIKVTGVMSLYLLIDRINGSF